MELKTMREFTMKKIDDVLYFVQEYLSSMLDWELSVRMFIGTK